MTRFACALDGLYDAALNGSGWDRALQSLAQSVGAQGCVIVGASDRDVLFAEPSTALAEMIDDYLNKGWCIDDPRVNAVMANFRSGHVYLEQEISTEDQRRRQPYYREFMGAHGLLWWAGTVFREEELTWCLTMKRKTTQSAFVREESSDYSLILEHLSRVIHIQRKVSAMERSIRLDSLNQLGRAAFAVDSAGMVISLNPMAERLVEAGEFRIRRGRLHTVGVADQKALDELIRVLCSANSLVQIPTQAVVIRRAERHPLLVSGFPIIRDLRGVVGANRAILTVRQPNPSLVLERELFASLFDLTPAEARVAQALHKGLNLAQAGESLGVSKETVRGQLKSIFYKTGVNRQPDLMRLLSSYATPSPAQPHS